MKQRITKRVVDSLKPTHKRFYVWDADVTGFGLQVTPKGTKSYVFQYRLPGRGRSTSAKRIMIGRHGDLTPDQARRLAAGHLLAVKAGENPALDRRPGDLPTVAELAERFLEEHLPTKKKPPRQSTIDGYESIFRKHVLPRLGQKHVDEVTTADVERLHGAMRATPYVANRTLSLLQQTFDQAERWGWRLQHSNPALHIDRYVEIRRGSRKEVMLSPRQMARLLEAIDVEERAGLSRVPCNAIRVAFWTGWRIGEVLALEWSNVDVEKGVARLVRTKASEEEYRQIPVEALDVLVTTPRVAGCPFVFPGRVPEHLATVKKPWQRIRTRAGLDDLEGLGPLRLHDLRHNVVSWDVSRGVPLEIAGRNVGHRSRRSTEVYAHFAPDALKKAADERARAMRAALEEVP